MKKQCKSWTWMNEWSKPETLDDGKALSSFSVKGTTFQVLLVSREQYFRFLLVSREQYFRFYWFQGNNISGFIGFWEPFWLTFIGFWEWLCSFCRAAGKTDPQLIYFLLTTSQIHFDGGNERFKWWFWSKRRFRDELIKKKFVGENHSKSVWGSPGVALG